MIINITPETTIAAFQKQFHELFPHLKVGFFVDKNRDKKLTADELQRDERKTLGSISETKASGSLEISGSMTVEELEFGMLRDLGLHVQVFRRSGTNWLATSNTDEWTLNEQEIRGKEMSEPVEAEGPEDYQEHE
jgi:hypothetical protein